MRAIPFRLICLLGMNDGDYPRTQYAHGFDLMNQRGQYRPGDRSRRQDDQYLFLEALLSARQQLYISWVGRSIRDNSERPPSVLIAQLRDFLQQSWCLSGNEKLLDALTVAHPLQPFSLEYVSNNRDRRLFTYAREWFETTSVEYPSAELTPQTEEKTYSLNLQTLARFLKAPVKAYCQHTLKFSFDSDDVTSEDNEPFDFDPLQAHIHSHELLDGLRNQLPVDVETFLQQQMAALSGQGKLPLASFAQTVFAGIAMPSTRAWRNYETLLTQWPVESAARPIALVFKVAEDISVQLSAGLSHLRLANNMDAAGLLDTVYPQLVARQTTKDVDETAPSGVKQAGLITLSAQTLFKKDAIQHSKLLLPWLEHLAACADGLLITSYIVGADGIVEIEPLPQAEALIHLQSLVEAWYLGLQAPLPLACRSAFAWLNAKEEKALEAAQVQYEGDDWNNGEVDYDAYLARFFPNFASLYQTGQTDFVSWVDKLYRPIYLNLKPKI
jgi:exodeoxyribonuclease V gamma subunit